MRRNYADARTLVIREEDDNIENPSTERITIVNLPIDTVTTASAITNQLSKEIQKTEMVSHHFIRDTIELREVGASIQLQEVVMTIINSSADKIAAGVVGALINELLGWSKRKYSKSRANRRKITDFIEYAKALIQAEFKPQGELSILKSSITDKESKISIEDSNGSSYEVKLQHVAPFALQAYRAKRTKTNNQDQHSEPTQSEGTTEV